MDEEIKKESFNEKRDQVFEKDDIKNNKYWAILCYLGALVVLPLLLKQQSKFVQFHVKQGLIILIGWAVGFLPFGFILALAALVFSVMGIVSVIKGEERELPIIGDLAKKIKL